MSLRDRIARWRLGARVAWKRMLSYRKRTWEFKDYPILIRDQGFEGFEPDSNATRSRFFARIQGWWALDSLASTREEALQGLRTRFEEKKRELIAAGEPIPRPGTEMPIQFASQACVNAHPELSDDFIHRVLQLEWALITDESSLWDFTLGETIKELQDRIFLIYGVAVYDLEDGKITAILDRVATERGA